MEAQGLNTARPSPYMLRSQGPVNALDDVYLNPADCYVRSYTCNHQCNVNASFRTVSPPIRVRRRNLVIEISALLGDYPGDWFAPSLRPRNLPLHPHDWSTTLLQQLCSFVLSLPIDITPQQRLVVAHETMLSDHRNSDRISTEQPANEPSDGTSSERLAHSVETAKDEKIRYASESSCFGDEDDELEQLQAENRRLVTEVKAMHEELSSLKLDVDLRQAWIVELDNDLVAARVKLSNLARELEDVVTRKSWFERDVAMQEMRANNDAMRPVVAQYKQYLGFV